jgi:hypothetical protein
MPGANFHSMFMSARPASVVFTDESSDDVDRTTYTFSTQAIGTAAPDRRVIVGLYSANTAGTVNSVSVGGVAGTQQKTVTSGDARAELWIAAVPTGATGDVVVVHSAGQQRCAIVVWAAYGLNSSTATDTASASSGDPITTNTLDVQAGGIAVAMVGANNAASGVTWTGLTEVADGTVETVPYSGASLAFSGPQTNLTVEADLPGTPASQALVVAAFR